MATKAGTRHKSRVALRDEIPETLSEKWEMIVPIVGARLFEVRKKMRQVLGKRPYKSFPVDVTEEGRRWQEIKHDQEELLKVFEDNAKYTPDGRVLVPKELVEAMRRQQRARKAGGFD